MQKTVNIAGESIIYRDLGAGPVVVLLHGYGGHPSHWGHVGDELAKDYRVVIPSLSGLYLNRERRFTFSEKVAILAALIEEVVPRGEKIHLAGNSYGGTIAWALATELRERVAGITLLSPMPPDPLRRVRNNILKSFIYLSAIPFALRLFLFTPQARHALPRIEDVFIGYEQRQRRGGRLDKLNSRKLGLVIHILNRFRWIATRENWKLWESRLRALETPICLIWGSWDRLFGRDVPEELKAFSVHIELHIVEKAGHLPMKENPEAVLEILRRFLKTGNRAA